LGQEHRYAMVGPWATPLRPGPRRRLVALVAHEATGTLNLPAYIRIHGCQLDQSWRGGGVLDPAVRPLARAVLAAGGCIH
jgi:hypothetical protein